jgi:membrane protease YdiL (CAAX protease family)
MLEILFALIVVVFLPVRAWRRYKRRRPPTAASIYILETALLTGALAGLLWRNAVPLQAIGIQSILTLRFVIDLSVCLTTVIGLDLLTLWLARYQLRRGSVATSSETSGVYADAAKSGRTLHSFIPLTIIGAIWEELCFRAAILLLVPRTLPGLIFAVLGGSLLFGLQHLRNGVPGVVYSFFYGVMFSCLYLATRDLIAVIVAHVAGNLFVAVYGASRIEQLRREAPQQAPVFLG